jgi:hypothetical protein
LGRILPVSTSSLQVQSTSIDQSTAHSCSASVISDRDVDDSTDVFSVLVPQSGSVYPAAVEGSKKLEVNLPSTWNAQSILTMSKEGKEFVGKYYKEGYAYDGAKVSMQINENQIDNREWLSKLVSITAENLPIPKPKKLKK